MRSSLKFENSSPKSAVVKNESFLSGEFQIEQINHRLLPTSYMEHEIMLNCMRNARFNQERTLTETLKKILKYDIFSEMEQFVPRECYEPSRSQQNLKSNELKGCIRELITGSNSAIEYDGASTNYSSDQKSENTEGKISTAEAIDDIKINEYEKFALKEDGAWPNYKVEDPYSYFENSLGLSPRPCIFKKDANYCLGSNFFKGEEESIESEELDFSVDNAANFHYGILENKFLGEFEFNN